MYPLMVTKRSDGISAQSGSENETCGRGNDMPDVIAAAMLWAKDFQAFAL